MTRITVPYIDANIVDVTVTDWCKQPGEALQAGEIIAEVTTDKAAYEIEAPCDGTLLEIYAAQKSVVPVHYIIGLVGVSGEQDDGVAAANEALMQAYRKQVATAPATTKVSVKASGTSNQPVATETADQTSSPKRTRATPKARRLAKTHGIDLKEVQQQTGVALITEKVLAPFLPREDT